MVATLHRPIESLILVSGIDNVRGAIIVYDLVLPTVIRPINLFVDRSLRPEWISGQTETW